MLKSSLCDHSDAYILVSGTITAENTGTAAAPNNRKNIIKNCARFTDCISEINNAQIDNAKDIDIVMPMYNLIEFNFVIIIQKHLEVYGNNIEMNNF